MKALATLVLVLTLCSPAVAGTPGEEIRNAFAAADRVLNDPSTQDNQTERLNAILAIVARVFAFRDAAEMALGREWRARTPVEQDEFTHLFANLLERSLVFTLATRARLDGGVEMRQIDESISADTATVKTAILSRTGSHIPITYRMIARGDRWMVRDVVIDGISVVENYHAQIRRVRADVSFDEMLTRMRAKIDDLSEIVAVVPDATPVKQTAAIESIVVSHTAVPGTPPAIRDERPIPVADITRPNPMIAEITRPMSIADVKAPATPVARDARRTPEVRTANDSRPAIEPRATTESRTVADARPVRDLRIASATTRPARAAAEQAPRFWVQVGAFKDSATAQRLGAQLKDQKLPVWLGAADARDAGGFSRVRVGPYVARAEAVTMLHQLETQGFRPFIHVGN